MSMKLHLGVNDLPYATKDAISTGSVAEILEAKYHIMEVFYELHQQEIADALTNGIQGSLETLLMSGKANPRDLLNSSGTSQIVDLFHQFLLSGEVEKMGIPGVPTKAAIDRKSSRFKKKRGPNKRPSFVDTGTYESSFQAWLEGFGYGQT